MIKKQTKDPNLGAKDKQMLVYEKETGKKAIWQGKITGGFKDWALEHSESLEDVLEKDKKKKSMVSIPETSLKKLLEDVETLKKNNELLLSIADKKRLGLYMQRHKEKTPNIVRLRMMNGKIVVGWKLIKDVVQQLGPGRWLEDQKIKVLYHGVKEPEEMRMVVFERDHVKVECERIGVVTNESTGRVAFKLRRRDNQKEYTIGVQFVN